MIPWASVDHASRDPREAPGAFAKNFGASDVAGFLASHLVYGVSVGILYAYFSSDGTGIAF